MLDLVMPSAAVRVNIPARIKYNVDNILIPLLHCRSAVSLVDWAVLTFMYMCYSLRTVEPPRIHWYAGVLVLPREAGQTRLSTFPPCLFSSLSPNNYRVVCHVILLCFVVVHSPTYSIKRWCPPVETCCNPVMYIVHEHA